MRRAETVLRKGEAAGVFTAVAAEVGNAEGPLWQYAGGRLGVDDSTPVDTGTIFDLASLTKVIATTAIALTLTQRKLLQLDTRVSAILPEWRADDRAMLTLRDLAEHCSGLPAHREYFRHMSGLDAYRAAIAREPLEYTPRTKAVYSDLGFIAFGAALECLAGASLADQFEEWKAAAAVTAPLAYRPPDTWRPRTAITGHDAWRARTLQGEVHDQNAAALGGVAAHAGLFGTVDAVGAAARWWLRQFESAEGREFMTPSSVSGSSRAVGWDTMRPTSSCGTMMSQSAVGHTGFTGTSLWIDVARGRYFALLSNRVHVATPDAMQQVRREFHDAAHQDLS